MSFSAERKIRQRPRPDEAPAVSESAQESFLPLDETLWDIGDRAVGKTEDGIVASGRVTKIVRAYTYGPILSIEIEADK